jgi:hypothetical protein
LYEIRAPPGNRGGADSGAGPWAAALEALKIKISKTKNGLRVLMSFLPMKKYRRRSTLMLRENDRMEGEIKCGEVRSRARKILAEGSREP